MKKLILFIAVLLFIKCQITTAQTQKEILLVGTFHFDNPGLDVAQLDSYDILGETAQQELKQIATAIADYNPDKIFVEWEYNQQEKLNVRYQDYINEKAAQWEDNSLYKNEIFQLAAPVAKVLNHKQLYAIDYRETEFPYDSLMQVIETAEQTTLLAEMNQIFKAFTNEFNEMITTGKPIREILFYLNSEDIRKFDKGLYTNLFTLAGKSDNFIGAYTASEWYRRNIYMLSLIQKKTQTNDQRIMLLAGASHIAIIKQLIDLNPDWKVVELQDILPAKG